MAGFGEYHSANWLASRDSVDEEFSEAWADLQDCSVAVQISLEIFRAARTFEYLEAHSPAAAHA